MRKLDKSILFRKFALWIIFSTILLASFFTGYFTSVYGTLSSILVGIIITLIFSCLMLIMLLIYTKKMSIDCIKIILIWILFVLNAIFAYLIGFIIPTLESAYRENTGYVMIPLLIILNYVLVDRIYLLVNNTNADINIKSEQEMQDTGKKRPVIEYEGKKYFFSVASIITLAIGAPLLAWFIYLFFDNVHNYWLHEIVVKQTAFFLRLLFNMNVTVRYDPVGKYHWGFRFPEGNFEGDFILPIDFETFCTGIQAICVFAGIIIFTPHSRDPMTKKDVIWRKTKSLIVSSALFYIVNIIRMLIQLELYYIGYRWEDIHYSISAASSFIAAIIVLLLHKWIPEFIITIIYVGLLLTKPLKAKRMEKIKETIDKYNKVNINSIRKVIDMKAKGFDEKFSVLAKNNGFEIIDSHLIIPEDRKDHFFIILKNKFRFESDKQV